MWPANAAGALLAVEIRAGAGADETLHVRVAHLGAALNPDSAESLGRSLSATLKREVQLIDVAIPSAPLSRADGDLKFVADVSNGVHASAGIAATQVCVVQPEGKGRRADRREQELAATLRGVLAAHPRVTISTGEDWTVQFLTTACPDSTAVDAPKEADGTTAEMEHP